MQVKAGMDYAISPLLYEKAVNLIANEKLMALDNINPLVYTVFIVRYAWEN